ncbi:MAG: magnesium/cobalt transporter CorA [Candidatus Omnitrophica bacterium]|nr:magnesium/cobalt transporter CorA [Candidatus Omnitrophota bacterium]
MSRLIKKSRTHGRPEALLYEGPARSETMKITVFDYDEKNCIEKEVKSVEECLPFRDRPTVTWINVDGLNRVEVLEKLSAGYSLHHLVLEDILNVNQRPKFEDFGEYIYICAKMLGYDDRTGEISEEQVSFVLGDNFVITFQEEKQGDVFNEIRQRLRLGKGRLRKMKADYLAYTLLDAVIDNYFLILEKVGEKIEVIEDALLVDPDGKVQRAINQTKRQLIFLRKSVWPLREVVRAVTQSESALIRAESLAYFRDIYDHVIQAVDTIEAFRETAASMLDLYLSSLSHRLNEVMKVLTIIATIFIPLTFLAGLYGMNFNTQASPYNMPELNWRYGYLFVLGLMVVVVTGMLVFFKKKKWF